MSDCNLIRRIQYTNFADVHDLYIELAYFMIPLRFVYLLCQNEATSYMSITATCIDDISIYWFLSFHDFEIAQTLSFVCCDTQKGCASSKMI
jgi:hypothetical protein